MISRTPQLATADVLFFISMFVSQNYTFVATGTF